ncbi:ferredoxin reductase [Leucobacter coleopterorum]|uniref:Ferredoxin reductase n=1 Tax=Leucobacter coleopterorum TaxID=2714933 RepID=A0ABX6JV81_9MICO|nr:ferredoxin reductase [Leucobacter coleopterorum]QIM18222.1 ferredoxin reductase [Leucobacter coleopterorum]
MPWNRALQNAAEADPDSGAARVFQQLHPQEFLAECVETVVEHGDMMTFVFRRADGNPFSFRAGQYLNIAFPVNGDDEDPVDRSYSLSSSPTQPWTFSITVKRDAEGLVSRWAHEHVQPGTVLEVLGPVGAFHLPDRDRRARYLMLAAGSGITPLMSMMRTIHSLPGKIDAILLYHAATPEEFAFAEELQYLAATDPRIRVFTSLGSKNPDHEWQGMSGRLSADMLNRVAPDITGRQVYLCGPAGYLDTAVELLRDVGVDDTGVNLEIFSGDRETRVEYAEEVAMAEKLADEYAEENVEAAEAANLIAEPTEESVDTNPHGASDSAATRASYTTVGSGSLTMSFVRSGLNVRINPGERVLEIAKRAGVRIGVNCQEGMCGSCKSVKLEGEVEMNHQGGIRAREIEAGKFLPCCSTPLSNLVIDA